MGVTFGGLAGILERCPNLRSLGVNLDTFPPYDSPVHQNTGITRETFTDLSVGHAACEDVEAIGNLLAGMFPNLTQIYRAHPIDIDYDDLSDQNEWFERGNEWKEVESFITQKKMKQLKQNDGECTLYQRSDDLTCPSVGQRCTNGLC